MTNFSGYSPVTFHSGDNLFPWKQSGVVRCASNHRKGKGKTVGRRVPTWRLRLYDRPRQAVSTFIPSGHTYNSSVEK